MDLSRIVCQPTLKNSKKIKTITAPLAQGFGLDIFWYYSITAEGELTYIENYPSIGENFYSNQLYLKHPYFKRPDLLNSGFFFADRTSNADYAQTQGKLNDLVFNDQLFIILNAGDEKVEGYGFATSQKLPDLTNSIINNLFVFRKFIHYFHQENQDIFKQMHKYSVDISTECGKNFYTPSGYFEDFNSRPKTFSKLIDPIQSTALNSLSRREKECLKWFLKGFPAIQIGKKIHLSNRTVEFYIENVKNKLGCHTKQELYDVLLNYSEFLNFTFF